MTFSTVFWSYQNDGGNDLMKSFVQLNPIFIGDNLAKLLNYRATGDLSHAPKIYAYAQSSTARLFHSVESTRSEYWIVKLHVT